MNVEILSIGDEVLSGAVVNTNAAYISQKLSEEGFSIGRHTVVPDDPKVIKQAFEEAFRRARLVIATGGLGPTCDDLTRPIAAEIFGSDFRYDEALADDLRARYGSKLTSLKNQATVPSKAILIKNSYGTAPGLIFEGDSVTLVLLPGVPQEMRPLLAEQLLPWLKSRFAAGLIRSFQKQLHLFGVTESEIDPYLRKFQESDVGLHFGIYPSQYLLRVQLKAEAKEESEALNSLEGPYNELKKQFASHLFESKSGRLDLAVHEKLIAKGATLSAAESCTGGHFSAKLAAIPGASAYFLGGIIAYSNQMKIDLLGVSAATLKEKGAVSQETVREMAIGLQKRTKSDYALAISGIAGPTGGTAEKPIGTLWCALKAYNQEPIVWHYHAKGSREMIIEKGSNALLAKLYTLLEHPHG